MRNLCNLGIVEVGSCIFFQAHIHEQTDRKLGNTISQELDLSFVAHSVSFLTALPGPTA